MDRRLYLKTLTGTPPCLSHSNHLARHCGRQKLVVYRYICYLHFGKTCFEYRVLYYFQTRVDLPNRRNASLCRLVAMLENGVHLAPCHLVQSVHLWMQCILRSFSKIDIWREVACLVPRIYSRIYSLRQRLFDYGTRGILKGWVSCCLQPL